jgi:hypothetical protein
MLTLTAAYLAEEVVSEGAVDFEVSDSVSIIALITLHF